MSKYQSLFQLRWGKTGSLTELMKFSNNISMQLSGFKKKYTYFCPILYFVIVTWHIATEKLRHKALAKLNGLQHQKDLGLFFFLRFIYLAASGLSCSMCKSSVAIWNSYLQHVVSSSLTRDRTQTCCMGSIESQPLHHQGNPQKDLGLNSGGFTCQLYYDLVQGCCCYCC